MTKTVSIVTNNVECDELSSYYTKIEKYFLINGWKPVKTFDSDLTIIIACGTVDLMYDRTKNMLTDILAQKGNFDSTIIMGCQTITYKKQLKEIFNGKMISYKQENLLDDIINARFKFNFVDTPNVFNSPKQVKNNDKNKLFTIVISSGCLMKCTYCIIKKAHGFIKSKTIEQVSKEFLLAINNGYTHIALGGTDTSAYGYDIGTDIITLIKILRNINNNIKLYIDNLHPVRLAKHYNNFVNLAKENAFAYLHIPLQHVNDNILKRMGRETNFEKIYSMVKCMKSVCPQLILFTDFICGFPGETEYQYAELYDFVKNDKYFDYYYINEYCGIKGTESYTYSGKIEDTKKHKRYEDLIRTFEKRKNNKLKSLDQKTYEMIKHRYDIHCDLDKENHNGYYFCTNTFDDIIET